MENSNLLPLSFRLYKSQLCFLILIFKLNITPFVIIVKNKWLKIKQIDTFVFMCLCETLILFYSTIKETTQVF